MDVPPKINEHQKPRVPIFWLMLMAVATAFVALRWVERDGSPLPVCGMRQFVGIPCPFCGGTRAMIALTHGRVGHALAWNPLVAIGTGAALLFPLWKNRVRAEELLQPRLRRWIVLLLALNWAYLVGHNL